MVSSDWLLGWIGSIACKCSIQGHRQMSFHLQVQFMELILYWPKVPMQEPAAAAAWSAGSTARGRGVYSMPVYLVLHAISWQAAPRACPLPAVQGDLLAS